MVSTALALPKVTVPGPLTLLQVAVVAAGGLGRPSSVTVPSRRGRGGQGHRPVGAGAHDGGDVARGRAGAVLDVEERGEVALERLGRTSSGAGELDAQRVALGPSGPAHHCLHERGDVGRLLRGRPRADGGPGGRVPGHRRRRDGPVAHVAVGAHVGRGVVRGLGAQGEGGGVGADLVGLELDPGPADRRAGRNLEAAEAEADALDLGSVGDQLQVGADQVHPTGRALLGVVGARQDDGLDRGHPTSAGGAHGDDDVVDHGGLPVRRAQPQHVGPVRGERGRGVHGVRVGEDHVAEPADLRPGHGRRAGRVGSAVVGDVTVEARRRRQGHGLVGSRRDGRRLVGAHAHGRERRGELVELAVVLVRVVVVVDPRDRR